MPKAPLLKPWSVSSPVPAASFTSLLFVVVIVGCVYVGREVLVPMALAILLCFALTPPVELLQRLYVPRIVAVIGVVLLAFGGVFGLGGLMVSQVNQLAGDLPSYSLDRWSSESERNPPSLRRLSRSPRPLRPHPRRRRGPHRAGRCRGGRADSYGSP
jgi:predicted PurR-regulated permease PerM